MGGMVKLHCVIEGAGEGDNEVYTFPEPLNARLWSEVFRKGFTVNDVIPVAAEHNHGPITIEVADIPEMPITHRKLSEALKELSYVELTLRETRDGLMIVLKSLEETDASLAALAKSSKSDTAMLSAAASETTITGKKPPRKLTADDYKKASHEPAPEDSTHAAAAALQKRFGAGGGFRK